MCPLRRNTALVAWCAGLLSAALCPSALAADVAARSVDDARLASLEKNTEDRSADTVLELALAYDERDQTAKAMEYYQQAAAQGVGVAELRLGWLYESGTGGEQSYPQARTHYERAIILNVPEANLRLGLLYLEGWGVPRDVPAAVRHLQVAGNAGYPPAQKVLSEMYFTGTGVATDLKQALSWAELAAARQDPAAQTHVGDIRRKAARLPQDIRAAREWYQLSCEQEYTEGMIRMAATFIKRGADAASLETGILWLELAVNGGNSAAAFHLAGMYLWYPALRQSDENAAKARSLLKLAAEGGENVATEVLELTQEGQSLANAFRFVMTVPYEDRYVQRLANRPPSEGELKMQLVRPRPNKMVNPVYPAAMKVTRTEGEVMVEFIIDSTGRTRDARVVSSTHPAFADNAVASILSWRFIPGYHQGRSVNTRVRQKVEFHMKGVPGAQRAVSKEGNHPD